jgi:hypothetical protein
VRTGEVQNDQLNEVLSAANITIPPTDSGNGEGDPKCHMNFLVEINATLPDPNNHAQQRPRGMLDDKTYLRGIEESPLRD